MHIKKRTLKLTLFTFILVISVALTGCMDLGTAQAGWSGVVVGNGSIYLGSATGKLVSLNSENGFYQWQESLGESTGGGGMLGCAGPMSAVIYSTPALYDGTLFIGDYSGKLYAFGAADRQSKSVMLNESRVAPIIGSPVVSHDNVYIGSTDGNLYAYDAASLTFRWRFETGGEIWTTPAVWQDTLFVGSFDKKVYAINANSGQAAWDAPFEVGGPIIASPVVYQNLVIITSLDRTIYALDTATGQLVWQYPTSPESMDAPERWLWSTPIIHEGILYAPGMDGNVYAIEAANGSLIIPIVINEPIAARPVIAGNHMVVATEWGKVYSVNLDSYQRIELRNLDTQILAPLGADGTTVYIHSIPKSEVYALNGETGALLWSTSIN